MKQLSYNKTFKVLQYYILLLLGLFMTSWILWSRFIRERTIRDIPDKFLTEYRFWFLTYLCCIYLIIIKGLIKPPKTNIFSEIFYEIGEYLYKPLKTLDHLIKYNSKVKPYYYKLMSTFANSFHKIPFAYVQGFILFMQVFPRIILVIFLIMDVFYFNKLELTYKIILLGLLPFMLRYIKYSLKDILNQWISDLEEKYSCVYIYEKGYKFDKKRIRNTAATFHGKRITIKEYIETKFENIYEYIGNIVKYEYEALPYNKEEVIALYNQQKYNGKKEFLPMEDYDILDALYNELMPNILLIKQYLYRLETIKDTKLIKWSRIVIFSLYFICWIFVLSISYFHHPIELHGCKCLLYNFLDYLQDVDSNPFHELNGGSHSENLITPWSLKKLLYNICWNIIKKFL